MASKRYDFRVMLLIPSRIDDVEKLGEGLGDLLQGKFCFLEARKNFEF